jgi:hypothetical protein
MERSSLEVWQLMVDFGLLILIWLVQLIIYPSFRYCDATQFQGWHNTYTGLITLFVVPLMFAQVGIYAWLAATRGQTWDYVALGLIASVWIVTFAWSVPCHDRLHRLGYDVQVIDQLVRSNWPRTAAWTAILIANVAKGT